MADYVFNASDSTLKSLDKITDFTRGSDKIDLSHLGGSTGGSGHQDFEFIGSKAFSAAELAVQISGTTTLNGSDFQF